MKTKLILLVVVLLLAVGCADVATYQSTDQYGFWNGLWHGIVAPFSFIGSLFSDNIAMYAINNNGHWYDFGFALGAGILSFGGRRVTTSSSSRNE